MKKELTNIRQLKLSAYEKRDQQNECCPGLYTITYIDVTMNGLLKSDWHELPQAKGA